MISKRYAPKELIAFDFMPEQIERAGKKDPRGNYFVGDVTDIQLPSNKFDAAFVFGILHHVPDWEEAIRELYRVFAGGGVLLIEEVNSTGVAFVNKYFHLTFGRWNLAFCHHRQ
jgi:ubiquinone/menaquinone biosynthesis C-methylase UbiE